MEKRPFGPYLVEPGIAVGMVGGKVRAETRDLVVE